MGTLRSICKNNNISIKQLTEEIANIIPVDFKTCSLAAIEIDGKKYIFIKDDTNLWERMNAATYEIEEFLFERSLESMDATEMESSIFDIIFSALSLQDKHSTRSGHRITSAIKEAIA